MNKYELIAFDLDGTLLDKGMILTEKTKDGLKYIHSHGIKCAVITGRSIPNIIPILKDLDIEYLAGLNGAHIYNNTLGKTEYTSFIKKDFIKKVQDFVLKQNLASNFFSENQVFITGFAHHRMTKLYQETLNPVSIEAMADKTNILSIQVMCDSGEDAEIYLSQLQTLFGNYLSIENTGYNFLQISNLDIKKSNALKYIVERSKTTLDKTIAIGDSFSDISMIKTAGLGVGMNNGHKNFLKEVEIITELDNSQDGAVDFILKHIL